MAYIGLKQLDPILTGSLQVSGSAGVTGSFSITAGDKIFTGANENEYIQTDTTDRMRFVVGGNQMLLLDEDDSRVNVGYGMKLGVGLGNNTTPGEMLEVVGNISGSELGSFGSIYAATHITASGNISASGTIYADNFTSTGGDVAGISFADDLNITGHISASGNISASGDISADDVYIGSDTNTIGHVYLNNYNTTFMQMKRHSGDDKIIMKAGGQSMIAMVKDNGGDPSQIVFNDDGDDLDMRFEGSSDNSLLYLDGSQNSIQLGSAATTHVTASGNINTTDGRIYEAGTSVIDHATAMAIVFGG